MIKVIEKPQINLRKELGIRFLNPAEYFGIAFAGSAIVQFLMFAAEFNWWQRAIGTCVFLGMCLYMAQSDSRKLGHPMPLWIVIPIGLLIVYAIFSAILTGIECGQSNLYFDFL